MLKQRFVQHAVLLLAILWFAVMRPAAAQPRLVVVVVIDQMPAYFLDEFGPEFAGGFRRLLDSGAIFDDAHQDHAFTVTASGHASVSTGAFPNHHGIVGNEFWDRLAGQVTEAVRDADEAMVGAERRSGRSPVRMLRSAIGDWLKQRSSASKVFGISLKDRSAIFLGGLMPDGAYWYDERTGNFATSTYYHTQLPDWLVRFNTERRVDRYFGSSWLKLRSNEQYGHMTRSPEGIVTRSIYSEFPHALGGSAASPGADFYTAFRLTPFADRLTLDLGRSLLENEALGMDGNPDILLIGLSAADFIGHRYGPWSDEVRDEFLRLDGYLAEFLAFLDERIGAANYTGVLTSDHGVMPVPEQLISAGIDAARIHPRLLRSLAQPAIDDLYARGLIAAAPRLRYSSGLVFDFGGEAVTGRTRRILENSVADELRRNPMIDTVLTYTQLREGRVGGSVLLDRYQRSFHPDRSADVVVLPREFYILTGDTVGTTHGTPYELDTRVPLIFWGSQVNPGRHSDPARTVDIAPTLASLLGIPAPEEIDGVDLTEVLRTAD